MNFIISSFHVFWQRHPALLVGLLITFGALVALGCPWALFPAAVIFLTLSNRLMFFLFFLSLFMVPVFYQLPSHEGQGKGIFSISTLSSAKRGGWVYKGTLNSFTFNGTPSPCARRLPCTIFSKTRVSADHTYEVEGVLKKRRGYTLKTKHPWVLLEKRKSLVEKRLGWKETIRAYLNKAIPDERAAAFLGGLMTGELQDRTLFKEFGELGLSHLMAISGFHFSLLALFFHFFFRRFFSPKKCAFFLLAILTSYLIFLGQAPSVIRAWAASSLFFLGHLFEKPARALNSLGIGLCIAMALDPLLCQHLGFQLSFLATGALLVVVAPLHSILRLWIPKVPFRHLIEKPFLTQAGYLGSALFRDALTLSLAVHLTLLPLLLSLFHVFNIHSLFYNLFFPFLVSLSLLLFLCSMPFAWMIPPLGNALHKLNSVYTHLILTIPESPFILSRTWYVESLPNAFVAISLTAIFSTAILLNAWKENRQGNEGLEFSWI